MILATALRTERSRALLVLIPLLSCGLLKFTIGCGNGSETLSLEGTVTAVDDDRDTLPSTVVEESEDYDGYRIVGAQLAGDATTWEFKITSERAKLSDRLTFEWTFEEDAETYTGTDQAYMFSAPGEYLVTVTALTRQGTVAFVLTLQIEIPVLNEPPVADAGDDQVVDENALVFLYGGGSVDPDDDDLAYTWAQTSGPPVNLLHADEATARFVAPLVEEDTEITFALTVSDGALTDQAEVSVLVLNMIGMASGGPAADAGPDQVVSEFEVVTLDGSNSTGSEGAELIFEWFQASGPMVTLSNAGEAVATFEAPGVGGEVTVLLFELVVIEGDMVASDDVTITVFPENSSDDGGGSGGGGAPPPPPCQSDGDCDDNTFCNGAETCVDGSCQAGTPIGCDDGVDCTTDSCDEATDSCDSVPNDGLCDNGVYCDGAETCDGMLGCQAAAAVNCDDGVACTADSCNEATDSCENLPDDSLCDNGVFCDGMETCDLVLGCQVGTPVNCGDGIACTIDSCNEATDSCDNIPNDALCDNGLYCDGTETCNAGLGCQAGTAVSCDDGLACTADSCNEATDSCDNAPNDGLCDNGLYCDGSETCDPVLGCQVSSPVDCEDGVACTVDSCNEATDACNHNENDSLCDNGTFCDGMEMCDVVLGCLAGSSVNCDDGIACTEDSCNELTESCDNIALDSLCDNGLFCDGAETCDVLLGCQAGSDPCPAQLCDEDTDTCVDLVCALDEDCDDGLWCNGAETCVDNICQAGTPLDCDDSVPCTVDSCNEAAHSCQSVPTDSLCDNGLFCDGVETCDAVLGCQAGTAVDCDDDVACTVDFCDEATDSCDNVANDLLCDNGLFCDGAETCDPILDCQPGALVDCDDGVACTADSCNEATDSCDNAPDDALCDNGLFCDGIETCDPVSGCQAGNPVNCGDGVSCTIDSCSEATDSCENVSTDSLCDNGLYCDGSETCDPVLDCQPGSDPCIDPALPVCEEDGDLCVAEPGSAVLSEDFETYACGDDPAEWFDTDANNSFAQNDALFEVMCVGGTKAFGTASTATNIHSHYVGVGSDTWSDYTHTGRLMITESNSAIGLTFLSDYPNSDSYYRLRSYGGGSLHIAPHPDGVVNTSGGTTDSGVAPEANIWYRFRIEVEDTGTQTNIRAKVWAEGGTEPVDWQVDCYDDHANRLTAGTVGLWSMGAGNKYWDNLEVAGTDCEADSDGDGVSDCDDGCPGDPNKTDPGVCGCGVADTDSDGDGVPDCNDQCPGAPDTDSDGDGVPDCIDGCPADPNKTAPGDCGCGVADTDSDGDGTADCIDDCPDDPNKTEPGICGCGVPDTDSDGDGTPDCLEPPTLCVSPTELDFGSTASSLTFEVWNCGGEVLDYTIVDDADWLTVSPASGDSSGEHDTITATVDRTGLPEDGYAAEITVTPSAGSAFAIAVSMTVGAVTDNLLADFGRCPSIGPAPLAVNFEDRSVTVPDEPVAWEWSFGDGNTSAARNPTHTFNNPGTYAVTLTASYPDGSVGTETRYVTVTTPVTLPIPPEREMLTASRTSGIAPLSVFFDTVDPEPQNPTRVIQPPEINGHSDYASFHYLWNFGDDPCATWATNGKLQNEATGYVAAHVFENPGIYIVTLRVIDTSGQAHDYHQEVTVQPFSGMTYYVSSSAGADSNSGLSPAAPFATVGKAMLLAATNTRILFKRGDTWSVSSTPTIAADGPGIVGAYFNADGSDDAAQPKPRINQTSTSGYGIRPGNDWRIIDLELVGPAAMPTGWGIRGSQAPQRDWLALRVDVRQFFIGVGTHYNWGAHDHLFVVSSEISGNGGSGGNNLYLGGTRLVFLGTTSNGIQFNGEHIFRCWHTKKAVISSCAFRNANTAKHEVKLHNTPLYGADSTQYVIFTDNEFGREIPGWTVTMGPKDSITDVLVQDVLLERNWFSGGTSALNLWARHVVVRNNVFHGDGNPAAYFGIRISRRGIEPLPFGNHVYSNTCYRSTDVSNRFTFCEVVTGSGHVIRSNLASAPNVSTQKNLVLIGDSAEVIESHNSLLDDPGFRDPAEVRGDKENSFMLLPGSPVIDSGYDVNLPFGRAGAPRYDDPHTTPNTGGGAIDYCDRGAYEYARP